MTEVTDAVREIESVLVAAFSPQELLIEDDSVRHAGHAGNVTGGGHYQVTMVSDRFKGLQRIAQHRLVYEALGARVGTLIHALALQTRAPDEN